LQFHTAAAAAIKAPHKQLHGTEVLPWAQKRVDEENDTFTSAARDKEIRSVRSIGQVEQVESRMMTQVVTALA
jgi:hypothetical protein